MMPVEAAAVERRLRNIPLMLILSPRCASDRISAQFVMVRDVPPPPPSVSSCFSRAETAGWCQFS